MELRHLKYFLAVAEELNFSKAAEKLFISQPPLSRQIKELEDELGARLFDRNNKRVVLTDAGSYFLMETKNILDTMEKAQIMTKKIANHVSGEFRIGYISSTYSVTITHMVSYLSEKYPYVKFKLHEVPTTKQISALGMGKLDFGILRAPVLSANISTQLWFKDSYAIAYHKQKIAIHSDQDIERLKDQIFVFFNKDYAPRYYDALLEICADYGFVPHVVHESNNINSILQLVKNGLGVSIVPASLAKSFEDDQLGFYHINNPRFFTEVMLATVKDGDSEIVREAMGYLKGLK